MAYIKVYIHFVWSTKNREPFLKTKELRQKIWQHIRENAKEKGIFVDFINGYAEHCHCLISLGVDQTIQKTMQLIKGESAFWINRQNEFISAFAEKKNWNGRMNILLFQFQNQCLIRLEITSKIRRIII